jgi:soluble P-type ATPase
MRPEAANALTLLHDAGIEKVVMLSGDNQRTVDAIARQAGIDEAYGDLMPEQKIEHIKRLMAEHHYVGMIGDGVNDAPALALASVGIAMGAIGSDTAIETADMALMQDDLTRVAEAIALRSPNAAHHPVQRRLRPHRESRLPHPRLHRPHQPLARHPRRHRSHTARHHECAAVVRRSKEPQIAGPMSKLSRKKKAAATPTALAPRDKAMLIGVPILLLAIPALVLHFSSITSRPPPFQKP